MPLHPQAKAMIGAFSEGTALDFPTLTATEFRAAFHVPAPVDQAFGTNRTERRIIEQPHGPMSVKLYYPEGDGPFPMTLYIHGGGFVIGTPDTADGICRTLADGARSLIVSPDYRLAPEAAFPAGLEGRNIDADRDSYHCTSEQEGRLHAAGDHGWPGA